MSSLSRHKSKEIINEINRLQISLSIVQNECDHEVSVYKPNGSSGNWDKESYYWHECYCYDCKRRWSVDQESGKPPCNLKVEMIDPSINAEKIHLLIKAEKC